MKRYRIIGDESGHEYFVEVGMEGEFENWLVAETAETEYENDRYEGRDYNANRIDGRFTFTDPRND